MLSDACFELVYHLHTHAIGQGLIQRFIDDLDHYAAHVDTYHYPKSELATLRTAALARQTQRKYDTTLP